MRTEKIIDGLTAATGQGTYNDGGKPSDRDKMQLQVEVTAAANVSIKGRVEPSMPFVEMSLETTSGFVVLDRVPELKVDVDSNTGTVNVAICQ